MQEWEPFGIVHPLLRFPPSVSGQVHTHDIIWPPWVQIHCISYLSSLFNQMPDNIHLIKRRLRRYSVLQQGGLWCLGWTQSIMVEACGYSHHGS